VTTAPKRPIRVTGGYSAFLRSVPGTRCRHCGKPLTYMPVTSDVYSFQQGKNGRRRFERDLRSLGLCVRCVTLALCRITVLLHGDVMRSTFQARKPFIEEIP